MISSPSLTTSSTLPSHPLLSLKSIPYLIITYYVLESIIQPSYPVSIIIMKVIERSVLVSTSNCYLHRVSLGTISLIEFGNLQIITMNQETPLAYLTVGDFHYFLEKKENVVVTQIGSVTTYYLLDGNTGLYAFSLPSEEPELLNLEKTLEICNTKVTKAEDLDQEPEVKTWVEQHRPNFRTENVVSPNIFSNFISRSGAYVHKKLGSFENNMVSKIKNRSEKIISGMDQIREDDPEVERSETFSKIKKGASYLYGKSCWLVSSVFDPLVKGIKKGSNKISEKIDKSNSNFLKKTKEFLSVSELSIRNSVEGIRSSVVGIGGQVINEGAAIIALKTKSRGNPAVTESQIAAAESQSEQKSEMVVETSQMAMNPKKEQMVFHTLQVEDKELELPIPKEKVESIPSEATTVIEPHPDEPNGIVKIKNSLEDLSDHQSVEEQV